MNKDIRDPIAITSHQVRGIRSEGHVSAVGRDGGGIAIPVSFIAVYIYTHPYCRDPSGSGFIVDPVSIGIAVVDKDVEFPIAITSH